MFCSNIDFLRWTLKLLYLLPGSTRITISNHICPLPAQCVRVLPAGPFHWIGKYMGGGAKDQVTLRFPSKVNAPLLLHNLPSSKHKVSNENVTQLNCSVRDYRSNVLKDEVSWVVKTFDLVRYPWQHLPYTTTQHKPLWLQMHGDHVLQPKIFKYTCDLYVTLMLGNNLMHTEKGKRSNVYLNIFCWWVNMILFRVIQHLTDRAHCILVIVKGILVAHITWQRKLWGSSCQHVYFGENVSTNRTNATANQEAKHNCETTTNVLVFPQTLIMA